MVIVVTESAPRGLGGELSRWLTKVGTGVFVGILSADVRQLLWEFAVRRAPDARLVMIHSCRGEPGYSIRTHGYPDESLIDLDGLPVIAIKDAAWREALARFPVSAE